MFLAVALTWLEWSLLGTVVVCTAVVMTRAFGSRGGSPVEDPDEGDEGTDAGPPALARRVANLEVRLHDFAREVEARLEKRAVDLEGLVTAADRQAAKLTDLLRAFPSGRQHPAAQLPQQTAT